MNDDDPFASIAEDTICAPRKAVLRAKEKRAKTMAEKKRLKEIIDGDTQFRMWKKWHAERVEKLLKGPHRNAARELNILLENLTMEDGPALIEMIWSGPWYKANSDTRFLVLALVDARITYMREKEGLSPFSDSMPFSDADPTVFEIIRSRLAHDDV